MAGIFLIQLKAFIKRNFLLRIRNKRSLIMDTVTPLVYIILLVVIMKLIRPKVLPAIPSFPVEKVDYHQFRHVLYTPNTTEVRDIINNLVQMENFSSMAATNASDMVEKYKHLNGTVAGIVFDYLENARANYSIRLKKDSVPDTIGSIFGKKVNYVNHPDYVPSKFQFNKNKSSSQKIDRLNRILKRHASPCTLFRKQLNIQSRLVLSADFSKTLVEAAGPSNRKEDTESPKSKTSDPIIYTSIPSLQTPVTSSETEKLYAEIDSLRNERDSLKTECMKIKMQTLNASAIKEDVEKSFLLTGLKSETFKCILNYLKPFANEDINKTSGSSVEDQILLTIVKLRHNTFDDNDLMLLQLNFHNIVEENQCTDCPARKYAKSGFLHLQSSLDTVLIRKFKPNRNYPKPTKKIQLMPKPIYHANPLTTLSITALYLVMAYVNFVNSLCTHLVVDKEKKIRPFMQSMGMFDAAFWLSWAIVQFVFLMCVTIVAIIIIYAINILPNSNIFVLFIDFLLFCLTLITLAFVFSTFFQKSQTSMSLSTLLVLISMLYLAVGLTRKHTVDGLVYTIPVWGITLLCFFSPVAFALSIDTFFLLDITGVGMTFSNLGKGYFPMYIPMVMLIVDAILYYFLAMYLEKVLPSEYKRALHPLFFLSPSYWRSKELSYSSGFISYNLNVEMDSTIKENIEKVPVEMEAKSAIKIFNISKSFKTKKKSVKAVDNISMNIYEDEITCLLGHNGAGKTTLINMLIGSLSPEKGTADIYGYDIGKTSSLTHLHAMIGLCPQENILQEDLSCRENLRVFGAIKGLSGDALETTIDQLLLDLSLTDKSNVFSKNLSGGQKRKLSVGIAFIGNPKIVILDEPTAGVDPLSRRHLWNLLKNYKMNHTIILTTNFMDEADILSDRKAIISKGKLNCYGTSLFLKHKYGIGYHLNILTDPKVCNPKEVSGLLNSHNAGITLEKSYGSELCYIIPQKEIDRFPEIFRSLEETNNGMDKATELGIQTYGVSMTTLEDVFFQIGQQEDVNEDEDLSQRSATQQVTLLTDTDTDNMVPLTTIVENCRYQQFLALLKIFFLNKIREPLALLFVLVLPNLLVLISLLLNKYQIVTKTNDLSHPFSITSTLAAYVGKPNIVSKVPPFLIQNLSFSSGGVDNFTDTLSQYVSIDNSTKDLLSIAPHFLGANFKNTSTQSLSPLVYNLDFVALYNSTALHSLPAIINLMSNILLNSGNNSSHTGQYRIETSSWPWPEFAKVPAIQSTVFSTVFMVSIAFILVAASLGINLVRDRELNIRSQLRVTGVSNFIYWSAQYVVDYSFSLVPIVLILVMVLAFQIEGLNNAGAILALILVTFSYSACNQFYSYMLSFMFNKYETCQAVVPGLYITISLLPSYAVLILFAVGMVEISHTVHYICCLIFPSYCIFGGLFYIAMVNVMYKYTSMDPSGSAPIAHYFKWDSLIPYTILVCLFHAIWIAAFINVLDKWKRTQSWMLAFGIKPGKVDCTYDTIDTRKENDDVSEERQQVDKAIRNKEYPMALVKDISKIFGQPGKTCFKREKTNPTQTKLAVDGISFCVNGGEVLGLLGPNGAGKTTTISMLNGELTADSGQIFRKNQDSAMKGFQEKIGYCPQHDALWMAVTLREHIECYGKMRGIPKDQLNPLIDFYLKRMNIEEHAKKQCKALSGGTKRKLSYIMSVIGDPPFVLLDEPSTGMDPISKRFMWNVISSNFQNNQRGAILTTHYMEEADALCSRVGIMVNGRMQCIGSTQQLKQKYGSGYQLDVKISTESTENLEDKFKELETHLYQLFPSMTITESVMERKTYKVSNNEATPLSKVFTSLQHAKETFGLSEYSFSQSTLEQVFLQFARKQKDEDGNIEEMTDS